ncbi:glycosyltransferase family 4 protein [Fructilactobacillus sanfranciscensis]|uniref:glycosyltransferase family 4 protein n=1 Tax=Fructilactobacillus sanfranciscensis TaxID=1625 RepID=UPI0031FA1B5C
MLKVGYICETDITDIHVWSGTIANLNKIIKQKYKTIPIVPNSKVIKLYNSLIKISNKLGLNRISKKFKIKLSKEYANYIDLYVNKNDVDILFAPAASNLVAFINTNIPLIYLSDATFNLMNGYYWNSLSSYEIQYGNMFEKDALENATDIIYSSNWAKKDAISFYKINRDKIYVLPFGANLPDKYVESKFNEKIVNLLFVGVDWERKGMDTALETVSYLNNNSNGKKYVLNVIGLEKPENKTFENVIFHGFVSKNDSNGLKKIIDLYNLSNIFIFPTRAECSAIVLSEAAEYSLPVVTYDTGGLSSYVINNDNGYRLNLESNYVDFANVIIKITSSQAEYEKFSKNARKLFENELNWSIWLEKFSDIVENAVKENK